MKYEVKVYGFIRRKYTVYCVTLLEYTITIPLPVMNFHTSGIHTSVICNIV